MFLVVRDIDTFYGVFQAIFKVSFSLSRGEVVCLLGRNGAGKTTTLTSIVGLNRPRAGQILFKDMDITGKKPHQIARMGIGFVPEDRWVFSELTVRENLELGVRKAGRAEVDKNLDMVFSLFPKLKSFQDRKGGTLSGGEQQMLTVARTLMGRPELVLLDEPTAGLAPVIARVLADQIKQLKGEGYTLLLAEQNALLAMDISDRAVVIDKGSVVYGGNIEDLKNNREMMKDYLGV